MGNDEGFANNAVKATEYWLNTSTRPISTFSLTCPCQNGNSNNFQNRGRKMKNSKFSQWFMTTLGTENNFKDGCSFQILLYSVEPSEKLRSPDVLGTPLGHFLKGKREWNRIMDLDFSYSSPDTKHCRTAVVNKLTSQSLNGRSIPLTTLTEYLWVSHWTQQNASTVPKWHCPTLWEC